MDHLSHYQVIQNHFHNHHAMNYRLLTHRLVCVLHLVNNNLVTIICNILITRTRTGNIIMYGTSILILIDNQYALPSSSTLGLFV